MLDADLATAFDRYRAQRCDLVLACVSGTEGSTYRKTGAAMLLAPEVADETARFEGLVSGGCLEGDLLEHARRVLADDRPREVTYDLRDPEADVLWGLGLGCAGLIRVLLVALRAADDYQPLAAAAALYRQREPGELTLVIAGDDRLPLGASRVDTATGEHYRSPDADWSGIVAGSSAPIDARASRVVEAHGVRLLSVPIRPAPRLLVLGGGPDALPVRRLADVMGWDCPVLDHRPAYVERLHAAGVADARLQPADQALPAALTADAAGALVMSHHLPTDLRHLRELAELPVPWVGLLGPRARRERLLAALTVDARTKLAGRLSAPVGLDLGGEGADAIALAVVAQFQAVRHARSGAPLAPPC